jgi:hypothetical protein
MGSRNQPNAPLVMMADNWWYNPFATNF